MRKSSGRRKRVKLKRLRIFLIIGVILIAAGIGLFQYFRYYQYTSYDVVWEKEMKEGSFVGYMDFGGNVLKYSKDGASYIDNQGKEIWVQSFEMKSPTACVSGNYAAVATSRATASIYLTSRANGYRDYTASDHQSHNLSPRRCRRGSGRFHFELHLFL